MVNNIKKNLINNIKKYIIDIYLNINYILNNFILYLIFLYIHNLLNNII